MASFVGSFKVVTNSGQIIIGDTQSVAPKSLSKTINGSGSNITGDFAQSFNFLSWNNVDGTQKSGLQIRSKNSDDL